MINFKFKRFDLGLLAMEYIVKEVSDYKMVVIANLTIKIIISTKKCIFMPI